MMLEEPRDVRSGLSKADFDAALSRVRFTPDNGLQRPRTPRPLRGHRDRRALMNSAEPKRALSADRSLSKASLKAS
jgi:hypothetical protein